MDATLAQCMVDLPKPPTACRVGVNTGMSGHFLWFKDTEGIMVVACAGVAILCMWIPGLAK